MSAGLAERRRGALFSLFLIAGGLAAVAAITGGIDMRSSRPDLAAGPVVPHLAEAINDAQRITVVSAEASYRIEQVERGAERVWVMREHGDFPVMAGRLAQLTQGLAQLRLMRRMTSDPSKHARLGVDDPRQGGRGVLVQIEDGRGALLVNLILGVEPSGLYARRPDSPQAYAIRGELPPLRSVASWLELRPLPIEPARFARVEISPPEGRAYVLSRASAGEAWRIAQPAAATQINLAAVAERLTQLEPVDVQAAPAIQGQPSARIRAVTADGIVIEAELIESDGKTWLKLVARAEAEQQQAAAFELNNRVSGWAFALNREDVAALAPPLSVLLGAD